MAISRLRVITAGPLVTIQDAGRPGFMRFGVPASGPMDRQSFVAANVALGNAPGAAGIEISMGGLTLECLEGEMTFAVAGGGFQVILDETAIGAWSVATLRAGFRLSIRPGHWGHWTYLAFAGRLMTQNWLGSCATLAISNLGGGRLEAGQEILIEEAALRDTRLGPIPCPVTLRPRETIRVVLGPQHRHFAPETIETLLSQPFGVTNAYDRMGMRLAGPALPPVAALDIPSEPIMRGSIQVSGDGIATVLLADHQTTGGYPKIATILSGDIDRLVQLRARSRIGFVAITPDQAVAATRLDHALTARYLHHLAARA